MDLSKLLVAVKLPPMLHPQIIRSLWLLEANPMQGSVVTIGSFDGLHRGHQELIWQVIAAAKKHQLPSVVLTFVDLPSWSFQSDKNAKTPQLMSVREKCEQLLAWGIDYIVCQYFNEWLRSLSAQDFVDQILVNQLAAKSVIVGDDFRFGNNRAGNYQFLQHSAQHYGFEVHSTPTLVVDNRRVSSTRIRSLLDSGDIAKTNELLGRPYSVSGRVIRGKQLGRTLGFPTANIKLKRRYVSMRGVYVVKVKISDSQQTYWGVANLGVQPAVNTLQEPLLEVYLFDFDGVLYEKYLTVNFYLRLRDEQDFDTIELLTEAIRSDVDDAKKYIVHLNDDRL